MAPSDLHLLDAHVVVEKLKKGEVTPAELIDVVERRVAETNELVHATPTTCFDRARAVAAKIQHPENPPPGYLYGLPVLIKDCTPVQGVLHTEGSLFFKERIAEASAWVVHVLEHNGAIVVGKTNVPEFCAGSHTFNSIFPTTVNPWDLRTSAGGSSGGSASALASCQCWLASGSDLGGSLRTPAAFCGVVGMRPSVGRVPRDDPSGPRLNLHGTRGPMGRCVRDVGLMLDAMSQKSLWDFDVPSLPDGDSFEKAAVRGAQRGDGGGALRVSFSKLGCKIRSDIEALCRDAAVRLAQIGDAKPDALKELHPEAIDCEMAAKAFQILRGAGFALLFKDVTPEVEPYIKPEVLWNIHLGRHPELGGLAKGCLEDMVVLEGQVKRVFEENDILCTPATLDAAFDAQVRYPTEQCGRDFSNYLSWMQIACIPTVMLCPALVLPCGFLPDGRPVGLQIIGAPGNDALVLEAAAALEKMLDLPRQCPEPRVGTVPLNTIGPRSAQEAKAHHDGEVQRMIDKYTGSRGFWATLRRMFATITNF